MTEQFLNMIRKQTIGEVTSLSNCIVNRDENDQFKISNETRDKFGLFYSRNIGLIGNEEDTRIMSLYLENQSYINENDTNGIYVYIGTYMPSNYSSLEIEDGYPFEIEVDMNDPRATHRRYWNLEGVWAKTINIEDCIDFEKKNVVIYINNFYEVQKEFILTAVKENQKEAVNRLIKKYYK